MNVTHKFTTDLQARGITERIHAMQSDANTRVVEVTLLEGGKAWEPAGAIASVAFRNLKDGHKGWYDKLPNGDAACTVNGNVVTATLASAVLSGDGEVQAAIVFQDAQLNQLATFGFSILVEKNPAAGASKANDYYAYSTMEDVSRAVDAMLDSLEDTKAQLGQLVAQVNEAVAQVQQEASPAIVCEASGEVITVADTSNRALQGLTICGKTTQDGTPTPDAPIDLVSAGNGGSIGVQVMGKNLFDQSVLANSTSWAYVTLQLVPNTTYTASGTIPVAERTNIAFFAFNSSSSAAGALNQIDAATARNIVTNDDGILKIQYRVLSGDITQYNFQIEAGTEATAYEPYKEAQPLTLPTPNGLPGIPVTSGGNYTDSNGQQWVCDEIDLARGVYVQKLDKTVFDGSSDEAWAYSTVGVQTAAVFTVSIANAANINPRPVLCDSYQHGNARPINSGEFWGKDAYFGVRYIAFRNDSITDIASWRSHLAESPVTVLYQMETPVETALDADTLAAYAALHSNKPSTTVLNDAGAGQKVAYVADTKTYIDQKFTQLQSAITAAIGTI